MQSAVIYELNVDNVACHSILDAASGGVCASAGRHFELKSAELSRALTLVNERLHYDSRAHPTCAVPREAIVFATTQGKRAVDISLECNNVGGRVPTHAARRELSQMLRSFGFVAHVAAVSE